MAGCKYQFVYTYIYYQASTPQHANFPGSGRWPGLPAATGATRRMGQSQKIAIWRSFPFYIKTLEKTQGTVSRGVNAQGPSD
jgi:hypothetical protein